MRLFLAILITILISSVTLAEESQKTYLAQNLWYETPKEMWCINFKVGSFVPAGTEVVSFKVVNGYIKAGKRESIRGISFEIKNGDDFFINFDSSYHPNMEIEDYIDILFTNKSFEELIEGLSEREVYAIKRGILLEGMSKKSVLISYGKPAEHYTPKIDSDIWYYWMHRYLRKEIYFDSEGRTMDVL